MDNKKKRNIIIAIVAVLVAIPVIKFLIDYFTPEELIDINYPGDEDNDNNYEDDLD